MRVFENLREQVTLNRILSVSGSGKVRCVAPGHQDTHPSMHVYDDHVHCFSCGFHGDVVDVWAAMRGFERPIEAALDLARAFHVELPEVDPEARRKAEERRDKEDLYLRQARACHRALDNHPRVREWWESRGFDEELQARFVLGTTRDGTVAVIPYWHRGRVQGLIRRPLEGKPDKYLYPKAEEFADGHRPLFIPGPARAGAVLVEGIIDALAIAALGESAIAVGGTRISSRQMAELERLSGPLYILPDADEEGAEAARQWTRELYPKALLCSADYGEGKDAADLFADRGGDAKEILENLKAGAADALALELSGAPKGSNNLATYRVAKESILPLLLKLEDEGERDAALRDVADKLKLPIKPLRKALATVQGEIVDTEEEEPEAKDPAPEPGTERYERAMDLLKGGRPLSRAAWDMRRLGHVGEFAAKRLAFVCAVSARASTPIQPVTHAQSSAGKNFLWDTVLSLLPEDMVVRRSGLSAKALFRTEANLKRAILYLQEVAGSEDANYTIRVMQSDGQLEYEATEKMPDGGMKNVVYRTEGPTVVVQTTTKNHLHPENETRVFPIFIDESEEQTERINNRAKREAAGKGIAADDRERIVAAWQDAIRLLEPAEVVIPYAERIQIPNSPLRIRRDARRLLDVVRVIAWLHQYQRTRDAAGRILATEDDFHEALGLVSESLRRAWQTLTPAEEKVLKAIKKLPEIQRTRNGFKRRELKVKGVSDRRVKEILKSLADTGYLECDGRQGPQGYTYTLVREAEEISLGISLDPPPDNPESGLPKPNANGRKHPARSRPVPDGSASEESHREAGESGRKEDRPVEVAVLQEKRATGRTGGEESKEKISSGRRLTTEEVEEYQRLKSQGMSPDEALANVLGSP